MPFVFNHLNQKLEVAQIEEAEKQSKRIASLGKQLKENPEPVEKLSSFIDKYGWLPKDMLAGLGIASLTNPAINLSDEEPFVADLIQAWTKNNKENSTQQYFLNTKKLFHSLIPFFYFLFFRQFFFFFFFPF